MRPFLRLRHVCSLVGLAVVLCVLPFGLPSCHDAAGSKPSIPVSTASVSGVIGPEGGTLTHPTGAQVIVPPGALATPTALTLTGIAAPSAEVLRGTPLGQGYAAGPEGQIFLRPVDIVIPFDPTRVAAGTDAATAQIRMARRRSTAFVPLQTALDLARRTLRARTVHFTDFVPAQDPNPVFISTPPSLPQGTAGTAYAQPLAATGGTPPYTWSLPPESALPPGLALSADGVIAGIPTLPSLSEFFVAATDSVNRSVQMAFTMAVVPVENPVPVLVHVDPTSALQGSPATAVMLTGSGFIPTSQTSWDGSPLLTTFASGTQVGAAIPAIALTSPGSHQIAVSNPAPGGGISSSIAFTVQPVLQNPVPTVATVSPTELPISQIDTQIAVVGTNFIASSSAVVGSQGIPTKYVSATELSATIPGSYLGTDATLDIGVFNPPPGGGFSPSTVSVIIGSVNPVPVLTTLAPSLVSAGSGDFTLNVMGSNFVGGGVLFFGTTALTTGVSSASTAYAPVPATLVASAGTVTVTFVNPMPGGGASNATPFTIGPAADSGADAPDSGTDAADANDCIAAPQLDVPFAGGSTSNFGVTLNSLPSACPAGAGDIVGPPMAWVVQTTAERWFTMWFDHSLSGQLKTMQLRNGCQATSPSLASISLDMHSHAMLLPPGVYTFIDCSVGGAAPTLLMQAPPVQNPNTSCATALVAPATEPNRDYDSLARYFTFSVAAASPQLLTVSNIQTPVSMRTGTWNVAVQRVCDDAATNVFSVSGTSWMPGSTSNLALGTLAAGTYSAVFSNVDPAMALGVSVAPTR